MGWGKPFSKNGWLTKAAKVALPVAASFIPGVGPLAAAGIGAGIGSLGGESGGGGLSGALMGGLTGGLSGLAAPGITSALSGSGTGGGLFSSLSGGLGNLLGTSAGTPLAGGAMGATQGTGLSGLATRGITGNLNMLGLGGSSLGGLGSILGGAGKLAPLTSLLSGAQSYGAQDRVEEQLKRGQDNAMGVINPYLQSGGAANTSLTNKLASGDLGGTFTPGDLTQDPGYQFMLQQGQENRDRKNAASGNFFSGAALKEAQEFGQGLADQTYNDAFNRWLNEQKNTYGMLSDQSGVGQAAAGSAANIFANKGNIGANTTLGQSNLINNTLSALLSGSGALKTDDMYWR